MEEAGAESNEVFPVPQVFHQHHVSSVPQHTCGFAEQSRAVLSGTHLMSRVSILDGPTYRLRHLARIGECPEEQSDCPHPNTSERYRTPVLAQPAGILI